MTERRERDGALIVADTTVRDECLVDRSLQRNRPRSPEGELWRMGAAAPLAIVDSVAELARLGVDVIEAGFACVSEWSFGVVEAVARELRSDGPVVSSLVAVDGATAGVDRAWAAVRGAARPRLHVFTTNEHATDADGTPRPAEALLTETREAVERAHSYTADVEFSPIQADGDFAELVAAMADVAVEAGATVINIRTCGTPADYATTYRELLAELLRTAPALRDVTLSADPFSRVHRGVAASDDALACAQVAIDLGARQIKCAMHGVAATTGHVRMEELSLRAWSGSLATAPVRTRLDHRVLLAASAKIAAIKGYEVNPSDPFAGSELTSPSPRDFGGFPWERAEQARERAALLRELGQSVPDWLEKPALEWPLEPLSGP
jgi:2-isopropylmalate synthase